jgi:hypothetical protein
LSLRGTFNGSALSSNFDPVILRGIDRQIGLTERLAVVFNDQGHPAYIEHLLRDLFAQRIDQIVSGYE